MRSSYAFVFLALVIAVATAPPATADPGDVTITVVDRAGAPIAGTTVLVSGTTNSAGPGDPGDVEREALTDARGIATVRLPPGFYTVTLLFDGYDPVFESLTVDRATKAVRYRATTPRAAEEIVVDGEAPDRPRDITRYQLSRDELRVSAGTNGDALLAVQNLPGVARPPVMTSQLLVRGAGPDDTATFVDGTQIPLTFHFGGVNSVLPSEALERLEFAPGNFGPRYGRVLGGIVELELRSPRRAGTTALVQVDALDGRLFLDSALGTRARFFVGARRSWVDAWIGPVLETTGNSVASAPVYYDGQAVLEVDATATTTARLAWFGSSDAFKLVIDSPMAGGPAPGELGIGADFWRVQARTRTVVGKLRWTNVVAYGRELRDLTLGTGYVRLDVRPLTGRSELEVQVTPRLAAAIGVDVDWQSGTIGLRVPPGTDDPAPSPTFGQPPVVLDFEGSLFRPGAHAGLEWVVRPGLELYPSLRLDYTSDGDDLTLSPRLNARWRFDPDKVEGDAATTVKAGLGVFHQPPQPGQAQAPYGNPALANGRAVQAGAGVERSLGGLRLSAEGYHKWLRDLVVQRSAAGETLVGTVNENLGSGSAWGVELLARGQGERVSGSLAYTFSRSKRRDAPGEPLEAFVFDQPHTITALGAWRFARSWTGSGRFRLTSGTPDTPLVGGIADLDAGAYGAVAGASASQRLAPFHQLDLRIEKQFRGPLALAAYLDVQNVYNRANPVAQGYNYNYTTEMPVSGLPILPIIGVRGQL